MGLTPNEAHFCMNPAFPRHEILQGGQKKTGLSKNDISFSIVCLRFLQKIKNPKKSRKIAYFALFLNEKLCKKKFLRLKLSGNVKSAIRSLNMKFHNH